MKIKELLQKYTVKEILNKYMTSEIYLTPKQLESLIKKSKKGD